MKLHILIVSVLLVTACFEDKKSSPLLKIGTNVWPGYEPLYYAQSQGDLPEAKYKLVEFPSATETIKNLRGGLVDFAALTLDEVLLMTRQGTNLKILFVTDFSHGGDVIMARPDITNVGALKGKAVGFEDTALGGFVLHRALSKVGLTIKDIKPVFLEVHQHLEAYRSKTIDAVVTFEPVRSALLKEGQKIIFSSKDIPQEIVDVVVVRQDVFDQFPNAVLEVIEVWFKTLKDIQKNKDRAYEIMAKREQISSDEFRTSLEGLIIPTRSDHNSYLYGKNPSIKKTIDTINRYQIEAPNVKTKPLDVNALLNLSKIEAEIAKIP